MSLKGFFYIISFTFFFIISLPAQGQEICNNGLDDDLDGFVDCYDRDCIESAACEDAFVEGDPSCEVVPSEFPTFSLSLNYASPNRTSSNNGLSAVGDVDGDGINDIVTTNTATDMVYVLDGRDGSIKYSRDVGSGPSMEVMIGDVDGDGQAEIFVPLSDEIKAFNADLSTELWSEDTRANPGNMGLADFDGDGLVELYARDEIFDALTGERLHASDFSNHDIKREITLGSIAVDILEDAECTNCDGLELIAGGRIYSVDIDRVANTAVLNLERSIDYKPQYSGSLSMNRTGTSIADYNLDGYLDVLTSGVTSANDLTRIFFWDVKNNVVKTYNDPSYNWANGTGRLNVADIDGDGQLNVTYVTGAYLYALDENFDYFWRSPILENTSGTTGTTVFDFNGDGKFETVYRDEQFLYIVDGTTGNFFTQIACSSLTYTEYPIVADVDGDGATEICVSCLTNDGGDIWSTRDAQIRVYESNGEEWVPARKVWNQHGYFNVNVNDNLTIPRQMQKHHLTFSTGVCSTGDRQPLNTFLNQAPYLTVDGCANYSAPDLGLDGEITVNEPHCPETEFTISFSIINEGDREVSADVPISFYTGDPFSGTAGKLNTIKVFLDIPAGETVTVNDLAIPGPGADFPLYISLNDAGEQTPPISFPAGGILECDYGDNVHTIPVGIAPAELIVSKIADNNRCLPGGTDNGAAQAAVNAPEMIWLEDFEDLWEGEDDDNGETAWEANDGETNRLNGDMKFRVRDDQDTWESEAIDISGYTSADLSVDLYQEGDMEDEDYADVYYVLDGGTETLFDTNGENKGNFGTSRATTSGLTGNTVRIVIRSENSTWNEEHYFDNISVKGFGNATAGYTFYWYAGSTASGSPIHTGSVATGLATGDYTVRAIFDDGGCSSDTATVSIGLTSLLPEIVIDTVKYVTNCNELDGALKAIVTNGEATDYEFAWYDGLDIFTSPLVSEADLATGLDARAYTVLVTDKESGCQTITTATVPSQIPKPVVSPTVEKHVTDCADPESGEASAMVNGQGIIWLEDFEDLDEGDESDNGSTAWSSDEDADYGEVRDNWRNRFGVKDGRATWESEVIDISNYNAIDLSLDLYEDGNMRDSDYIEVYYVLNGGGETLFPNNGRNENDFGTEQATVEDLNGNTVQIIIKIRNNENGERHYFDNIKVEGVGNFTDGYIFEWYTGSALKPTPDFTGSSVTNLTVGDYLVTATSPNGCTSDPVPFTIDNNTTEPDLSASVTADQTSCDPFAPTGAVEANVDGITTGYTFEWYEGQTTDIAHVLSGSPSPTLSGLEAGIYTVKAINDNTGCFSSEEVTIDDERATVTVTATATDQINCAPANGSITATAADGNGNYTYYWFDGEVGSPDIDDSVFTGATYNNLQAGDYTVIAVDGNTCASGAQTFTVDDLTSEPIVSVNAVDNTSCTTPNGSIEASVSGTTTGYTFQWFLGHNNTDPVDELAASPAPSISGLAANVYTVMATNDETGCSETQFISVIDRSEPLTLTRTSTPNSICDPAKGYTGTVTVTYINPNHETGDVYVYELFDASGNSLGTQNDSVFTALSDGDYTVQVSNTRLDCTSDQVAVNVANDRVEFDITVVPTPMTTCSGTPNGGATANIAGATSGYVFEWFYGSSTSGTAFATGPTVTELDGAPGNNAYTLLVTHQSSGCYYTAPVTIADETVLPTLTVSSLPNDICDASKGFNGEITATPENFQPGDNYEYELFDNTGTSLGSQADSVFTGLVDGDYTVVITNTLLGCSSDAEPVAVGSDRETPIVTVDITNMTTCLGTPNGAASADVGGVTAGYDFKWFKGSSATGTPFATGPNATELDGTAGNNTYTVLVTNTATGCFKTAPVTISDDSNSPTLTLTSQPNSVCDPVKGFTGEITATLVDANQQSGDSHVYTLYNSIGDSLRSQTDDPVFAALEDGDYTVTVTNTRLGCTSASEPETVENDRVLPEITVDVTPMTTCSGTPNGAASAHVGGVTAGYDFEWFVGTGTTGNLLSATSDVTELDGTFGTNDYTVKVTNQATGCWKTETIQIQDLATTPDISLDSKAASTICDPAIGYDGAITVRVDYKGADVTNSADYAYTWYKGETATPGNELTGSDETLNSLDSGFYTVVVVNTTLQCTAEKTLRVDADKDKPVIDFTKLDQTSCNPSAPNGQLITLIDNGSGGTDDPANYTFNWYEGTGTVVPVSAPAAESGDGEQLDNLAGNLNYTVEVIRNATGCTTILTEFLPETITQPVVQIAENTPITICAGPNGPDGFLKAEADGGTGFTENDYTFHWMVGEASTASDVIDNYDSLKVDDGKLYRLFPSDYTVVATNNISECISEPLTIEVLDDTKDIAIDIDLNKIPTACGIGEGIMIADPSYDGISAPGDFNYEWYAGGPSNDSVNFFTNPPVFDPNSPAATTPNHNNLESGVYSIVVEHNSTGCKQYKTEFLPFINAHEVDETVVNSTRCDIDNGAVEIAITQPPTAPAGTDNSDYLVSVYEGTDANGTTKVNQFAPGVGSGSITMGANDYAPGFYTIVVQETYTGQDCETFTLVEIGADAKSPIVTGTPFANTSCGPFDGSVQLEVIKHADDVTPDNTFTAVIDPVSGSVSPQTGDLNATGDNVTFPSLEPQSYELTITDDDSKCFTTKKFTVLDQPKKAELTLAANDAILCDPSGSAEVTAIDGGAETFSDYEFTWYTDNAATAIYQSTGPGDNAADAGADYIDLNTIGTAGGGTFYVVAKKIADAPGSGGINCESGPFEVVIEDVAEDPLVNMAAFNNTSCDPTIGEGKIELIVTDPYASTLGGGYDDDFTIGIEGDQTGTSYSPVYTAGPITTGGLTEDKYTVTVKNNDTGCITSETKSIENNEQPLLINQAIAKDQELCDPDGEIEVTGIKLRGVDSNSDGTDDIDPVSNYEFEWYSDAEKTTQISGNTPNMGGLAEGDYYVVAKKVTGSPGFGCESPPHRVDIDDISINPTLALTTTSNTACVLTGGGADGAIEIMVTDGGLSPSTGPITSDYTYTWQTTTNPSNTLPANRSTVTTNENWPALEPGKYTLTVESNGTGCTAEGDVTVMDKPELPVLQYTKADQNLCDPSGSITINTITPGTISDYSFAWSKGETPAGATATGVTDDFIDDTNYPTIGADTYWIEGTKTVGSSGAGDGCSTVVGVIIDDTSVAPTFAFTTTANTACDPVGADGEIAIAVTDNGAVINDYNYTWAGMPAMNETGATIAENFPALEPGSYELTVTSTGTGCEVTRPITVQHNPVHPIFKTADFTIADQELCDNDGSIVITGISTGNLTDHSFVWSRGEDHATATAIGVADEAVNTGNYAAISADTYWVKATKNAPSAGSGDGCSSVPFNVVIDDVSIDPVVSFTSMANNACDFAFADGEINVEVTDGGANITNYNYDWSSPGITDRGTASANEDWTALKPGTYALAVESNGTGCTTSGNVTVVDDPALVTIDPSNLALTPNLNCDPLIHNGSAIVQFVTEDGNPFITGDYDFEWFEEDDSVIPGSAASINTLGPGSYKLKVTNNTTKCVNHAPTQFEIEDGTQHPVVAAASLIDNVNCAGIAPDGEITLDINSGGNPADFTIAWFEDSDKTIPLGTTVTSATGTNSENVTGLPGGSYFVEVIDNTSFIGCSTDGKITMEDDLAVISVARADINLTTNTICDPAFALYTGEAEVIDITEDGNKAGTGNYNFEWLDSNGNTIGGPSALNTKDNLGPGTYYVKTINQITNCVNKVPTEFVIEDESVNPAIQLEDFGNPTRCETINAMGYLEVSADNSNDMAAYNFTWFEGDPASGIQMEANNILNSDLAAGEYHIVATNNATGCRDTTSYVLETDVKKVRVSVSSQPVTFCHQDNGQLFARVAGGNHYSYKWFSGLDTTGTALYNQAKAVNVSGGDYTLVAIDNNDSFCKSEPTPVVVEVLQTYPQVVAQVDKQLTNCDPTNPNGVATALVDDLTAVDFYWYAGTDTTAAHFSNERAIAGLELGMYKVVVVDKTTQCAASDTIEVMDATVIPNTPGIDVVNHDFSCLDPNGMLTGHVDGRTNGYEFKWHDGNSNTGATMAATPGYDGLAVGSYTVVAINEKTGCESLPATAAIEDDRQYPEYDFRIENATCDNENGAAYILIQEGQTYNHFVWDVDGTPIEAPFIADVPSGDYEVTVTGRGECETTKTATIGTEIHAYNGLSPNGDGENEYFHISCIDSFKNNNVKIYNRAGQIVYEGSSYDNAQIRFEGQGNKGIYLSSNQLPDGTYFYIVDKGDGKKPSSGYLELVR